MSPFIVTIATMVGLILFGIPGIILALPGAAMIGYVLTKYYDIPIIEEENA
jgi:predicted PurR-regulated permease PerM